MKISFIGAGKVGTAFGKYLSHHYDIIYYLSKSNESAIKAADYVGCKHTTSLKTLVSSSDIIFITTGDNVIHQIAEEISLLKCSLKDKYFVHMSGAMTSTELKAVEDQGSKTASLHPLQTFSDINQAVIDLEETYFAIEGHEEIIEIVKTIKNPFFILSKEQKTKYHLSACVFSNYLVSLMDFGSKFLKDIGISDVDGLHAMKPLIDATLANVFRNGTNASLTGPIQRGDTKTLLKHMSVLQGMDLEIYKSLGQLTTERLVDEDKKDALNELWR